MKRTKNVAPLTFILLALVAAALSFGAPAGATEIASNTNEAATADVVAAREATAEDAGDVAPTAEATEAAAEAVAETTEAANEVSSTQDAAATTDTAAAEVALTPEPLTEEAPAQEDDALALDAAATATCTFSSAQQTLSADAAGTTTSTVVSSKTYLFLPSYTDITKVALSFEASDGSESITLVPKTGKATAFTSGGTINLSNFNKKDGAYLVTYRPSGSSATSTLYVMVSANIRTMYLISDDPTNKGRAYIEGSKNHSTKATGTLLMVDPDGTVVYNGKLSQIKGRGNSTWSSQYAAKKPYQIKLKNKTDLLETGDKSNKAKTWVLLANASDPTLLRNTIAYKLAKAVGLEGTPECAPVDLYYDGEYRGSYLLSEKVQIGSGRVDINNMEDALDEEQGEGTVDALGDLPVDTATNKYGDKFQYVVGATYPQDITGGYIVELDSAYGKNERCWMQLSSLESTLVFAVKDPENLSIEQMKYISERMHEYVVANKNNTSLKGIGDATSQGKSLLINELTWNCDYAGSSTYFYLPSKNDAQGNIVYAGPVWDFDTAFGVRTDGGNRDGQAAEGIFLSEGYWFASNSAVTAAETTAYNEQLLPLLKKFMNGESTAELKSFNALVDEISASEAMNHALWGAYVTFGNSADPYQTYAENVDYLRSWFAQRIDYLESYFGEGNSSNGSMATAAMYRMYNPNSGEHFYTASTVERDSLKKAGWKYEGIGWYAPTTGAKVYRLYSGTDHHYTTNTKERDSLISAGWKYESVCWYSAESNGKALAGAQALYREFNPNVVPTARFNNSGSHNYTLSKAEHVHLCSIGWRDEGTAWYGYKSAKK